MQEYYLFYQIALLVQMLMDEQNEVNIQIQQYLDLSQTLTQLQESYNSLYQEHTEMLQQKNAEIASKDSEIAQQRRIEAILTAVFEDQEKEIEALRVQNANLRAASVAPQHFWSPTACAKQKKAASEWSSDDINFSLLTGK